MPTRANAANSIPSNSGPFRRKLETQTVGDTQSFVLRTYEIARSVCRGADGLGDPISDRFIWQSVAFAKFVGFANNKDIGCDRIRA
jgi:hypothetical protein